MGLPLELLRLAHRFLQAMTALLQVAPQVNPQITPPRAAYYAACLVMAERSYHIPWSQLAGIIQHESQWRPYLIGKTNDYGLGQHHCPSFFCPKHPTGLTRALLFEPCSNIQITAQELSRKRWHCKGCKDYVRMYNPGNPRYAQSINRWQAKFLQAARSHALAFPWASTLSSSAAAAFWPRPLARSQ